jgi:hypothetical protein
MLILVFTPRESADIPVQIGPVPGVRLEGNTLRHAQSNAVLAQCDDHLWMIGGHRFYRADCAGPVTINPFKHFSLSDGMAHVDRAVFARLNSSNQWYVERIRTECPRMVLAPPG